VRWREGGHQLSDPAREQLLRFETADLNQVIKSAVAASPLYVPLLQRGGLDPSTRVLPLSCFAVTASWPPERIAAQTRYSSYRLAGASTLLGAGYPLWPTEVFDGDVPDPRNEVHYDLIVVAASDLHLDEFAGSKGERAAARSRLTPAFQSVMALLGPAIALPAGDTEG
jgi:hypothetical protein